MTSSVRPAAYWFSLPDAARAWIASAAAWVLLAFLSSKGARGFVMILVGFSPWIIVTALMPSFVARLPASGSRSWKWIAIVVAAGITSSLMSLGGSLLAEVAQGLDPREAISDVIAVPWWRLLVDVLAFAALVFWAHGLRVQRLLRAKELEARDLRLREAEHAALMAEARLDTLRSRIQPHFLFNALNSIIALVRLGRAQPAVDVLQALSTLMRTALREGTAQLVPLRDELAIVRCYLDVERTRLGDRLDVDMAIDEEAADARVPSLVLQPLVENAVRHGIERRAVTGRLTIRAACSEGALHLNVENDGPPLPHGWTLDSGAGVGLSLTRERLRHLYGPEHRLTLQNTPRGVVAQVRIPLREHHHADHRERALLGAGTSSDCR
jgi:signal transduction histidine kinase